ncbi:hypothetical protein ISS30_10905 [bacterium]|nr:hypothetical protein [FCB group bacterium]MBL7192188.1 hypothetical protein [bacterium]
MISAVIVTHGNLGQALIDSAFSILGEQEGISAISNFGLSNIDLISALENRVEQYESPIILVDTHSSTLIAAKSLKRPLPVISGVNLPMLLSFFTKRHRWKIEELVEILVNDGRKGIASL